LLFDWAIRQSTAPNALQGILIYDGATATLSAAPTRWPAIFFRNTQIWRPGLRHEHDGNVVLGNYIGTDAGGSHAVSNALARVSGAVARATPHWRHNAASATSFPEIWQWHPDAGSNVVNNSCRKFYRH